MTYWFDLSSISEVTEWPYEVTKQHTGTINIVSNSILTIIIVSFYMLHLSCFTVQSTSIQVLTIAFISILFLSKAFFSLRTESRDFCSKSFSCISCEQCERQESSCTVSSSTFASSVCWPSSAFSHCFLKSISCSLLDWSFTWRSKFSCLLTFTLQT